MWKSYLKLEVGILLIILPVIGLIGSFMFEPVRWLISYKERREILKTCYDGGIDRMLNVNENEPCMVLLTEKDIKKEYKDIDNKELYPQLLGPPIDLHKNTGRQKRYSDVIHKGRFINPFSEFCDGNPANILSGIGWMLFGKNRQKLAKKISWGDQDENLKVETPNLEYIHEVSRNQDKRDLIVLTWLGQSTCFIQTGGYNIITDPILSEYIAFKWVGPKRFNRAPCGLKDLPPIDIVLVSHDHLDHLERKLISVIGDSATWVVASGIGKNILSNYNVNNYIELSWWESCQIHNNGRDPITITATPAQHWGGSNFFNVNKNLWCSMFIETKNVSVFHCGDSGYCSAFKEIKKRIGSPDLALIPIGAYEPRWFLKYVHISPWEAIQVHKDLGAKVSFAIHWGTYSLSDEPMPEPPRLLKLAREKTGIAPSSFIVDKIGTTHTLDLVSSKSHQKFVQATI